MLFCTYFSNAVASLYIKLEHAWKCKLTPLLSHPSYKHQHSKSLKKYPFNFQFHLTELALQETSLEKAPLPSQQKKAKKQKKISSCSFLCP